MSERAYVVEAERGLAIVSQRNNCLEVCLEASKVFVWACSIDYRAASRRFRDVLPAHRGLPYLVG
jgi:hypothetical protein